MSDSLWPHGLQHARLPCPSLSPGACSNLCPLSQWCHPTISSSVAPFSSCSQSFPASGFFPMSWLFTSGGQSMIAFKDPIMMGYVGTLSNLSCPLYGLCVPSLSSMTSLCLFYGLSMPSPCPLYDLSKASPWPLYTLSMPFHALSMISHALSMSLYVLSIFYDLSIPSLQPLCAHFLLSLCPL